MNTSQTLRPEERRAASDPSMTGSKALIESFLQEGVETVFGYPGGAIIPVYDALYDYRDRLRHILVRHEQGAVHAAQGYARVSGRVGVCLVTSGPGATNTVTGLADALMDSTPLVLVTGQVGSALLGTDAFQETNFVGITQAVTKWNCQVKRTEDIPAAIAKAFYIARSGRPGPVVVDITKDAQCGTAPFRYEKITSIRSYLPAPAPDAERIAEAARLIERRSNGFSKPNQVFLSFPSTAQKCTVEMVKNEQPDCSKVSNTIAQNCTSNQINKNNLRWNKINRTKEAYGRYRNVFLEDYSELKSEVAELDVLIEDLSVYMQSTGKKYADHAATLRSWSARKKRQQKPGTGIPDYTYSKEESL